MTIKTFDASKIDARDLEQIAEGDVSPELRDVLLALSEAARSKASIAIVETEHEFTPSEAASHLRMSRTHLYKLLDSGAIVSHRVGRDRRIGFKDLADFEARRQADRRELAERFANQQQTRNSAIDELVELL